jgi:hypothetical protein
MAPFMLDISKKAIVPGILTIGLWPSLAYGSSSNEFSYQWATSDLSACYSPQIGPPYAFLCVAGSAVCVATADGSVFLDARQAPVAGADAGKAIEGLREAVSAITNAHPLPVTQDLDDLFAQAAQSQGYPADIEGWARDLAAEVSHLAD